MTHLETTLASVRNVKKDRIKRDAQESLTFRYHELLKSILNDMERLEKLIPIETSRNALLIDTTKYGTEVQFIIEARKDALLRYIQTVFRDHIAWSRNLLAEGFSADGKHQQRHRAKPLDK